MLIMVISTYLVHSIRQPCEFCGKLLKTQGRSDAKRKHLERCLDFVKSYPGATREEISSAARIAAATQRMYD